MKNPFKKPAPAAPQPQTVPGLVLLEHEVRALETHSLGIMNILNKARTRGLVIDVDFNPAPAPTPANNDQPQA